MASTPDHHYPTFAAVWDGSAHKIQTTSPSWSDVSSQQSHQSDKESSVDDNDNDPDEKTSRMALFSPGAAARALWSVSSPNLSTPIMEWTCEECNHGNVDTRDSACAYCGARNNLASLRRDIFIEEDGMTVSPIKTPSRMQSMSSPRTASLRNFLTKHSSAFSKSGHDEEDPSSCGSATTTPTANLSPASTSPENWTSAMSRMYQPGNAQPKEEVVEFTSFSNMGLTKKEELEVEHEKPRTWMCLAIPMVLTLLTFLVTIFIWMPHVKSASSGEDLEPSLGTNITGLWVQRGEVIYGDEPGYETGASISLAANGRVMAVGVGQFGPARVFSLHDEEWHPMGQDLFTSEGAKKIALSRNHGHTMAIASESDGSVIVFHYNAKKDTWMQLGSEQEFGVTNHDDAQASVALSYDGEILAIGIPSEKNLRSDSVRVLQFDSDKQDWSQVGTDIILEATTHIQHGGSVSLSSDGMVLAVGSWTGDEDFGSYASHAEVYHFVNNTWQPRGKDKIGSHKIGSRVSPDKSPTSVSLSGDGSIVAIGSGYRCRVFTYDQERESWDQIGQDIMGRKASLSVDGSVLAVGNPVSDDHGNNAGETSIYTVDEQTGQWTKVGEALAGEAPDDWFGEALSVSQNGKRVAVGAPRNSGGADKSGSVSVYELI